mmetsp:Transcript_3629/g.7931  ORF Transcript_3629/g.7931 Transcript_3629/m.7931 type:complete len:203 (+) Transcript_3629:488-1096(+)
MHDARIPDRPERQRVVARRLYPGRGEYLLQPGKERGSRRGCAAGQGNSPRNRRNRRGRPVHRAAHHSAKPRLQGGRRRCGGLRRDRGRAGSGNRLEARFCLLPRGPPGQISVAGKGFDNGTVDSGCERIGRGYRKPGTGRLPRRGSEPRRDGDDPRPRGEQRGLGAGPRERFRDRNHSHERFRHQSQGRRTRRRGRKRPRSR